MKTETITTLLKLTRQASLLLLAMFVPQWSLACGTMDHWIQGFHGKGPLNDVNQKTALHGIYECARYHYDPADDAAILTVLTEASDKLVRLDQQPNTWPTDAATKFRGTAATKRLIEDIFVHYGCLAQADQSQISQISRIFDEKIANACNAESVVVAASGGANVRLRPGGKKLDAFKDGTRLRVVSRHDGWARVYRPTSVRDPSLTGLVYISEQFIRPID